MILNHLRSERGVYATEVAVRIESVRRDHENCAGSSTHSEVELASDYGVKAVADLGNNLSIIAGGRGAPRKPSWGRMGMDEPGGRW